MYVQNTSQATPAISLWDCARIVNMLVLLRLLRIIPNFRPMALVTSVLLDIIKSLKSFAGIIIIIYYVFAVVVMWCFRNAIRPPTNANATLGLLFKNSNSLFLIFYKIQLVINIFIM